MSPALLCGFHLFHIFTSRRAEACLNGAKQVALLHPKRRLQPRTYRTGQGTTLLVGGVARIDVLDIPGATIYLTVFASTAVACHMSKTDNIGDR